MNTRQSTNSKRVAATVLTGAAATTVTAVSQTADVSALIAAIRTGDPDTRGDAWQQAGPAGAPAVGPLSDLLTDPDFEVARSAKRALWQIVHYAGRPGAEAEARAVEQALRPLLEHFSAAVRREVLWMLAEIGSAASVPAMARLLSDREARDDARMALQRLPGPEATQALQDALQTAPEDFRYPLAEALRKRGVTVRGYPTRKREPGARPV